MTARMLSVSAVCATLPGLTETALHGFLREEWVRPARAQGEPVFSEADLARIQLIMDLRAMLEVEEETLPIVLSLLDQLYATRRQLRRLIEESGPELGARMADLLREE